MSANKLLTQSERAAVLSLAADTALQGFNKVATVKGVVLGSLQAAAALSIATGVPIGVAWHALGSSGKINRNKERDSLNSVEYYRNAAKGLEQRLASPGRGRL